MPLTSIDPTSRTDTTRSRTRTRMSINSNWIPSGIEFPAGSSDCPSIEFVHTALADLRLQDAPGPLRRTKMENSTALALASRRIQHGAGTAFEPQEMVVRSKFGQEGSRPGMFRSPHGFCFGLDEIVVADTLNHRIQVFSIAGDFRFEFGSRGKGDGRLWYPRKIAFSRFTGRFIICDRGSHRSRMQVFHHNGTFVKNIPIEYINIVAGLTVSKAGDIVVVDSVSPTIYIIAEQDGKVDRMIDCSNFMKEPSDIACFEDKFYVCDFKGHTVFVLDSDGVVINRIGNEEITPFPNGIEVSDEGDVIIGDSHGNNFHAAIYSNTGFLIAQFSCPYVKVSRCCGLKITPRGNVVTLAKNDNHVLVLDTLYVN